MRNALMQNGQRLSTHVGIWPALVGVAYFACAAIALKLTEGTDGIATVWPASGISISGLLLCRNAQRPAMFLAIALASFAANLYAQIPVVEIAAFTTANTLEAAIGYFCIREINRERETIYRPLSVVQFCIAALLTGTLSGAIASALTGAGLSIMFVSWATTVSLGIMIVVPLILNIAHGYSASLLRHPRLLLTPVLILATVAVVSYVVFHQSTFPLLFVPLMAVIIATYLIGPNGAMTSILIIAVIGSSLTLTDSGPIHLMRDRSPFAATLFMQFYLLVLLLSALPLAALLGARDRVITEVSRANRWLEMSEHFAHVGHWRLDLAKQKVFWSDEVFHIHGLEPGPNPPLEGAINYYHPDDRPKVEAFLAKLVETHEPFDFQARLFTVQGEERYVRSRGDVERNAAGDAVGLFGIFQDVTETTIANLRLAEARELAEKQADMAMLMAQTDALTGIANRRSALSFLETEMRHALEDGTPLSVAILDIDHFKSINDRYGHGTGDAVIRKTAALCSGAVRSSDMAGRIGGEEFVLILPGADSATAQNVGERVRVSIETADWGADGPDTVTASIGVATLKGTEGAEQLLAEADGALYRAKREGRNLLRAA